MKPKKVESKLLNICPSETDGDVIGFECGLLISSELLDQMDQKVVGLTNRVHQRHHDQNHRQGAYTLEFREQEDGSLRGYCSCWDEGG